MVTVRTVGPEVLVNTTTLFNQNDPSIAALAGGGYVVTWTSEGQDGSILGVYMQRYDASGAALGVETLVNTTTAFSQSEPSVAALTGGGYVVTWRSDNQDGSFAGVSMQRYDASGAAQGVETQVNTTTANSQYESSVAALSGGGYVVTWRSDNQDGSLSGVYMQRYDAAGLAQGVETQVNTTTFSNQSEPSVAGLAGGGYVVTWRSDNQDGSGSGVYMQRYDASGAALGVETLVNTTTAFIQSEPSVAALTGGGYVVTWRSENQDGSNSGVYSKLYGPPTSGPMTSSVEIADGTSGDDTFEVDASGLNSGDGVYGSAGTDTLRLSGGGVYTLVGVTLNSIELILLTNGAGTTLTLANAAQGGLILLADGAADTVILNSGSFTVAQRRALFDAGVETLTDAQGTFQSTNAAPVTTPDTTTVGEDITPSLFVLANDTDAEGETLSIVAGSLVVSGFTTSPGLVLPAPGGPVVDLAYLQNRFSATATTIQRSSGGAFDFLDPGQSITITMTYDVTDNVANVTTGATLTYTVTGALEVINGTALPDTGNGTPFGDNLSGLGGDDFLFGRNGNDRISGGDGDDELRGEDGNDILFGDLGDDLLFGGTGNDTVRGGDGQDTGQGGSGNDALYGDAGSDDLSGGTGADYLFGGSEADTLSGGDGADVLFGDAGDDSIDGGDGDDHLYSGAGDNVLAGGAGTNIMISEGASDVILGGSGTTYAYRLADGASHFTGGSGAAILVGGAFNSNDTFVGGGGDDYALGGGGNDTLSGGAGNDILIGGDGNDTLDGGEGINTIYADGTGSDRIMIDANLGGTHLIYFFEGGGMADFVQITGTGLASAFSPFSELRFNLGVAYEGHMMQNTGTGAVLTLNLGQANQTDVWFLGVLAGGLTVNDFVFV